MLEGEQGLPVWPVTRLPRKLCSQLHRRPWVGEDLQEPPPGDQQLHEGPEPHEGT